MSGSPQLFGASARPAKRASFAASAFPGNESPAPSTPPPAQVPAARPQAPGTPTAPATVQPQNPAVMPQMGIDFGGTNDAAMDDWLNMQAGMLDYPRHPKSGHFLTGPYKNKTPGQVREILIQNYRAGVRNPVSGPGSGAGEGGGLRTGTMTGKNPFTPDDVWRKMTQPGQIARPASSLSPKPAPALSPAVAPDPGTAPAPATTAAVKPPTAPVRPTNPAEKPEAT